MKRENLFKIASIMMILGLCSFAYAEDVDDLHSGPGVGLTEASWDMQGRVYTPGNNGIIGANAVVEANAIEAAPKTVESTIVNPINNFAVDMGPTSAANWQLSLHRIDDNGPGAKIDASIVNPVSIYGNVGPGTNIIITPSQDKGPVYADATTINVDPSNALLDMGPASSTEVYQHKKKNN